LTAPVPALPDSYLCAVRALPDDDGPRLVAADWWDEQGAAARAEFVRVQCELARLGGQRVEPIYESAQTRAAILNAVLDYKQESLRRRERELLAGSRGKWFDFPTTWHVGIDPVPVGAHGFQYRRGFFEVAALTAADFLACADALTAACPLKRVWLTTRPEVEWASADVALRLAGRGWRSAKELFPGDSRGVNRAMMLQAYLAAEFPGIDFEMPTVGFRPGSLPPSQLPLTTDDRRSPPRPSWSTRTH
jgi:uncharacterized protein (TIGR02996 family)